MNTLPELLPSVEYVDKATKLINAATKRVTLFTMIITQDSTTESFIDALCNAAKRGVDVRVTGDIFTLGVMSFETSGVPWRNKGIASTHKMKKKLKDSGVTFSWVGQLGPILYAQRTHVKWCIVDNYVFSFGGVNLYKNGIHNLDYMILLQDDALANRLEAEHHRIHKADRTGKTYRSHFFECNDGIVLVDGGIFGNSIIYNRACMLAKQATEILFVSQYAPSGKLSKILRDNEVQLYYNNWQNAFGMNKLLLRANAVFSKHKTSYTGSRYIHAKFIIFTMEDGHKVALTGSHNFEHGGVLLGTREIDLETTNEKIIIELETYFYRYIQ